MNGLKEVLFLTHIKRVAGPDPALSDAGLNNAISSRLLSLVSSLVLINDVKLVVPGEGLRFEETFLFYKPALEGIPARNSKICGTSASKIDGLKGRTVVLGPGRETTEKNYMSLRETWGFSAWDFLRGACENKALLISGRELWESLCLPFESKSSSVYGINPYTQSVVAYAEECRVLCYRSE